MPDDPLLDKVPPHSLEAEMATLGSMMLDPEMIGVCAQRLDADCFYRQEHRVVFQTLLDLYDANRPVDLVVVRESLRDAGKLEEIGGVETLVTLADSVATTANAEYYAQIVQDKAVLRGVLQASAEIIRDCHAQNEPVEDLLDKCEERIFAVTERRLTGHASDVRAILSQVLATLDLQGGQAVTGLETGYVDLDDKMRGLQPGELIILAARPSVGKSALALNIAEHVACDRGKPVAFFSLEMSKSELALRLLTSRAGIDGQKLRKGNLSDAEVQLVQQAAALLYECPLHIDDTPAIRVVDLRAKARRLLHRHEIQMVIVDYLQLMSAPRSENRQVEVASISRGLKALARDLNVPIVAMAQLRRETEEHKRPRLSDLRESGAIEQDADVVLLLHREQMRHAPGSREHDEAQGKAELIIAKQRNGPTGLVRLVWRAAQTRFESWAPHEADDRFEQVGVDLGGDDDEAFEAPF